MGKHTKFIMELSKREDPLISFKDLISLISNYTNKTPVKIADELESILFGFRQNGSYINSFCYCTIFDRSNSDREIYEPMTNNFKDAFDYVKGHLKDVISRNSLEIENLDLIFVRASEFSDLIKNNSTILEENIRQPNIISQNTAEYISLYDFIEWAKENYTDYSDTANDLIRLLDGQSLQLYRRYGGIKPSIEKDRTSLKQALEFVAKHNGYKYKYEYYDGEIPF